MGRMTQDRGYASADTRLGVERQSRREQEEVRRVAQVAIGVGVGVGLDMFANGNGVPSWKGPRAGGATERYLDLGHLGVEDAVGCWDLGSFGIGVDPVA